MSAGLGRNSLLHEHVGGEPPEPEQHDDPEHRERDARARSGCRPAGGAARAADGPSRASAGGGASTARSRSSSSRRRMGVGVGLGELRCEQTLERRLLLGQARLHQERVDQPGGVLERRDRVTGLERRDGLVDGEDLRAAGQVLVVGGRQLGLVGHDLQRLVGVGVDVGERVVPGVHDLLGDLGLTSPPSSATPRCGPGWCPGSPSS